jgi:hypothetical protein
MSGTVQDTGLYFAWVKNALFSRLNRLQEKSVLTKKRLQEKIL